MTNSSEQSPTGNESKPVTRRRVLKASAVTGGIVLGGTSAASAQGGRWNDAPGKGAAAVVHDQHFLGSADSPEPFVITGRVKEPNNGFDHPYHLDGFKCSETGGTIRLVGWYFEYVQDIEPEDCSPHELYGCDPVLYTRSNNVDTDATYTWSYNGAQDCGDREITLTSFKASE